MRIDTQYIYTIILQVVNQAATYIINFCYIVPVIKAPG